MLVELPFSRFFLAKLLGKVSEEKTVFFPPFALGLTIHPSVSIYFFPGQRAMLNDLASLDPEMHRNLLYVKRYTGNFEDLSLDMSVTDDASEGHPVHDLVPNGRQIAVTAENRIQYVYLVADYRLNRRIAAQTAAFVRGLEEMLPRHWLNMFGPDELQMLISGAEEAIDVEDMRRNADLRGFTDDHPTMVAFWNVLRSLPSRDVQELLRFVTSCPRPPLQGFAHLNPKLSIQNTGDATRLPSASTCMNLLKLPPYSDEATLRDRLMYAIKSNTGFGLS